MSAPPQGSPQNGHHPWTTALVALLVGALGLGGGMLLRQPAAPAPVLIQPPPTATLPAPTPTAPFVVVFVSGAVQSPGVYELPPGARVVDALAAAGGLSAEANPNAVNQAARLRDGDQVHIPTRSEAPDDPPAGVSGAQSDEQTGEPTAAGQRININTASQAALEGLPGIGPARARDIIANRPYTTVDELLRVPGIGPTTLERLRPLVTVE